MCIGIRNVLLIKSNRNVKMVIYTNCKYYEYELTEIEGNLHFIFNVVF